MTALHSVRSWIASVQFLMPLRSSLNRSHQRRGAPPGSCFFPLGLLRTNCLWGRRAGILQTCPNHCSLLCHNWSSIDSSPVISKMVLFLILSHKVTLKMSQRHLMWDVLSFLRSRLDTFQVSAPYIKTGITSVRKAHSLVSLLRTWLLNTVSTFGRWSLLFAASLSLPSPFCHLSALHCPDREMIQPLPVLDLLE